MGSVERISRTARPAPSKDGVDLARGREDAPAIPRGGLPMRYKVGAEQLQQVPTPPPSPRHRLPGQSSCLGRSDPRGLDRDRRGRLRDHGRGAGGAGPRLGTSILRREMPWVLRRRPGRRQRRAGSPWSPPMTSWRRRYGTATTEVVIAPESWQGAVAAAYRQGGLEVQGTYDYTGGQPPTGSLVITAVGSGASAGQQQPRQAALAAAGRRRWRPRPLAALPHAPRDEPTWE
jgi:hypothetical protein